MDIQAVLSKLAKGEELSEEDKKFASEFDVNKVINDTVAAAKRKLESKSSEAEKALEQAKAKALELEEKLKEKSNKGKTELETLQNTVSDLSKQLKAEKDARENEIKERTSLERKGKIKSILEKKGISFVKKVDHELMVNAFVKQFDGIDDLAEETIEPIVEQFVARNEAAIVDKSGHGSGGSAHDGSGGTSGVTKFTSEQIGKMSPAEYAKNREAIMADMAVGKIQK